jgi:hypothetical protein
MSATARREPTSIEWSVSLIDLSSGVDTPLGRAGIRYLPTKSGS